jgi:hypothetical protein
LLTHQRPRQRTLRALQHPNADGILAEWDFSGVSYPVMFQRFLDVADYQFGCSDSSSVGSYDPAHECFMVATNDVVDGTNVAGAGNGETPGDPRTSAPRNLGPSAPPPRLRGARTSTRN